MSRKAKTEIVVVLPSNALDASAPPKGKKQRRYKPPFNQGILGNPTQVVGLGAYEQYIARKLYELSEHLGRMNPEVQARGALGGEFGYGQDFKNEIFQMFPYYWGDCTCGWAEKVKQFMSTIQHKGNCFQNRWKKWHDEYIRIHGDSLGKNWRKKMAELDRANEKFCRDNGKPDGIVGCAVYCDCGYDAKLDLWCGVNALGPREFRGHASDCLIVRPNFHYGDISISWYKYIGRGMSINRRVTRGELILMFKNCFASLSQ